MGADMDIHNESPGPEMDAVIKALLTGMKRVAVVGISDKPDRASHGIAKFLAGQGIEVVGVNPVLESVGNIKVYPNLKAVPGHVDIVDIFRRSDAVPPIVDAAIEIQAGAVWMQESVRHDEAAEKARRAGLDVVMDRCIYKDWLRLINADR
jgi:uncharacterized protein